MLGTSTITWNYAGLTEFYKIAADHTIVRQARHMGFSPEKQPHAWGVVRRPTQWHGRYQGNRTRIMYIMNLAKTDMALVREYQKNL